MEHVWAGEAATVNVAYAPCGTGDVTDTNRTRAEAVVSALEAHALLTGTAKAHTAASRTTTRRASPILKTFMSVLFLASNADLKITLHYRRTVERPRPPLPHAQSSIPPFG
jgi:hypothetical protein